MSWRRAEDDPLAKGPGARGLASPAESASADAADRRAARFFAAAASAYALVLVLLAAQGRLGFVPKTAVVPALFVIAAFSRRLRAFASAFGPFLAAVILFDSVRGLIFSLLARFSLPFYAGYAIAAERALLGGHTLPDLLQRSLLGPHLGPGVSLLVAVHASHFLVFLMFALLVWLMRPLEFGRFATGLILVFGLGLVGYAAVPTIPPWMASRFGLLPPIRRVAGEVYALRIPSLQAAFDVNPIAAMPSLHAAVPVYLAIVSLRLFGRRGWIMLAYGLLVGWAICFLGEHYAVDVLAGVAVAVLAYLVTYRVGPLAHRFDDRSRATGPPRVAVPVIATALLLLLSQGLGQAAIRFRQPLLLDEPFISRELDDRSPLAEVFRCQAALRHGDMVAAEASLERALAQSEALRTRPEEFVAIAALAADGGNLDFALRALAQLPPSAVSPSILAMHAEILNASGHQREAGEKLVELARRAARDPEALYQYVRAAQRLSVLSAADLATARSVMTAMAAHHAEWRPKLAEVLRLRPNHP